MRAFRVLYGCIALVLSLACAGQSGLFLQGTQLTIPEGTSLYIKGGITAKSGTFGGHPREGLILSEGEVHLTGDLVNNADSTLFPPNAEHQVYLQGTSEQALTGTNAIALDYVEVDNPTGVEVVTNLRVNSEVQMNQGVLYLEGTSIDLGTRGKVSESQASYITGSESSFISATRRPLNTLHETGLGLRILNGNSSTADLIRYHRTLDVAEGAINRTYFLSPTSTQDLDFEFSYFPHELNGLDDATLAPYLDRSSTTEIQYRKAENPSHTPNEFKAKGTFTALNEGFISLATATCTTLPNAQIIPNSPGYCEGDEVNLRVENSQDVLLWNGGETNEQVTRSAEGQVTVQVWTDAGCEGFDTVKVTEHPNPIAAFRFAGGISAACLGEALTVENQSPTPADTQYFWNLGTAISAWYEQNTGTQVVSYDTAGTFQLSLSAISPFGCTDSTSLFTTIHPDPDLTLIVEDHCFKAPTFIQAKGHIPSIYDLGYSIRDPKITVESNEYLDSSANHLFSAPGVYDIRYAVTTNAGCTTSVNSPITVHSLPNPNFEVEAGCAYDSVTLIAEDTTHQRHLYSAYFTENSLEDDSLNFVMANFSNPITTFMPDTFGTFTVQLITESSFGCQDTALRELNIGEVPVSNFSLEDTCATTKVSLIRSSTASVAFTSLWDFGDGSKAVGPSPDKIYELPGTYQVTLMDSTIEGCRDTATATVTIHPKPVPIIQVDSVCEGQALTFQNNSSVSSGTIASHTWNINGIFASAAAVPIEIVPQAGTQRIQLTVRSDQNCIARDSLTTEIWELPQFTLGEQVTSCVDSAFINPELSNVDFFWSTGDTTSTLWASAEGPLRLLVSDLKGCTFEDSVTVVLNTPLDVDLGPDTLGCDSLTVDAFVTGHQYLWSTGDTTASINTKTPGEFWVELTSLAGCKGSDTIFVTLGTTPVFELGPDLQACEGDTLTLNSGIQSGAPVWSNGDETYATQVTESAQLSLVITDSFGCSREDSIHVLYFNYPLIDLGLDTTVCDALNLQYQMEADSLEWWNGTSDQRFTFTRDTLIWVEGRNGETCTTTDSLSIKVVSTPTITLPPDTTFCEGNRLLIDAGAGEAYLWSNGVTSRFNEFDTAGTYAVRVTNGGSCNAADSITIGVTPVPELSLPDLSKCSNETLTVTASLEGFLPSWYHENEWISSDTSALVSAPGTYTLLFSDGGACEIKDTFRVTLNNLDVAADFVSTSIAEVGDTLQFVQVSGDSSLTTAWFFGDGVTTTDFHPSHRFFLAGTYEVALVNSNGFCSDTLRKPITIYPVGDSPIDLHLTEILTSILSSSASPNPMETEILVEVALSKEGEIHLYLFDINGERFINRSYQAQEISETFDVTDYPAGSYNLYIFSSGDTEVVKLIKL